MPAAIIITTAIFALSAIFIPKRLTKLEIYTAILFSLLMELTLDIILDINLDLYGYQHKGVELPTLLVLYIKIPSVNVIIMNYFPFGKKIANKISYILLITVLSSLYELFTLKVGFLYYKHWNIGYSMMVYPLLFILLASNTKITRSLQPGCNEGKSGR